MFSLIFLMLLTIPMHQEGEVIREPLGQKAQANQPALPSAQEELLAELLAEQPANRRAELIARALANSRQNAEPAAEKTTLANGTASMQSALQNLRSQQHAVVKELAELRRESRILNEKLDNLALNTRRESNVAPQGLSRTFVLPNFQRPGVPVFSGPYVNQPSGPMITLPTAPEPETEQAITLELAQLSRDMFRLNQRLQKLQGESQVSKTPMDLNQPVNESATQAKRPSPLLPR